MSATFDSEFAPEAVPISETHAAQQRAIGARRFSWAEGLLAILALVSFVAVFMRLFERWRVSPLAVSHRIAILGQRLSYPIGNLAAIVVVALALLGAIVVAIVIAGAMRELRASSRFCRDLAAGHPVAVKDGFVIDGERPRAFCAGLLRPHVYVTTGALAILDEEALEAVLAHERHHARRRDPLRLAAGRVLARALFFLPGLAELGRRRETLSEISADESAIDAAPANRSALARAMLSFIDSPAAGESVGVDPARVDHLLGEAPSWRFPAFTFLLAVFLLALLAALAVLAGQEAAGSASLALPFLSAQPCVVVLALLPAGLALVAIALARVRRGGTAMLESSVD
ncbi:MAG: M56 family metallopeptidase [Solirubrobacterales bacterium]|nr:M56 family metallopeptidase [Solirubrobacterales bacterium]MBV9717427.1 M56 family metallopeptidase [Solirubrobacterales bacterium]